MSTTAQVSAWATYNAEDVEGYFEIEGGASANAVEEAAREALGIEESDVPVEISYEIVELDGERLDLSCLDVTPQQIADLLRHPALTILAAMEKYHYDADSAIGLLEGGYVVWASQEEVIDNFLEDYDLPSFIEYALRAEDAQERLWKTARDGRSLVEVGYSYVEFHR